MLTFSRWRASLPHRTPIAFIGPCKALRGRKSWAWSGRKAVGSGKFRLEMDKWMVLAGFGRCWKTRIEKVELGSPWVRNQRIEEMTC